MPDKCDVCRYRYACNEQDEFECKQRDYSRYEFDQDKKKYYTEEELNILNRHS